jgi:hypothetical protein
MANLVFDIAKRFLVASSSAPFTRINLFADTIKVALVGSTYVQSSSQRVFKHGGGVTTTSPSCYELNGTGYTKGIGASTGRKTLASKTVTIEDGNTRSVFTAANVTWTAINAGTAGKAVLLKEKGAGTTTSDTGSLLICVIDSGFPVTTNGGDLTIQWSTAGIIDVT